jgi:NAD(P)H dehydrogenase (quinone)
MRRSGSYYGATAHGSVTDEDRAQAEALGARVARTAAQLTA